MTYERTMRLFAANAHLLAGQPERAKLKLAHVN
jgi:hypothetical protein